MGGTAALENAFFYEPVADGASRPGPYFLFGWALGRGVTIAPVFRRGRWVIEGVKQCLCHPPLCGEGACSRWAAQRPQNRERCALQREQAPSPHIAPHRPKTVR